MNSAQEIHHRVKNNLQVICSLLNLQSQTNTNLQVAEIMQESQDRVKSMALVHENLYQSESLSKINFKTYVTDLTNNLLRSYRSKVSQIRITIFSPNIYLEIDTAVPCGLIINELVSNSLKYAFPQQHDGQIDIHMTQTAKQMLALKISDSGIGLPANLNFARSQTLGLRMVNTLTKQISGTITVKRETGTSFEICFPQSR
ncbi:sensor histidine kinase [Acaryochloris marina]|uniref:sensor histidine kinase n=1 Tax=Acaryochloris marina TaxID=155978 RepID=UPI001BAF924F|nr:histidine kinase dimerization/phosphoacceptor domain -containing protein [Acaryochloris marina]QUY46012.1 hypothetical protein I1H34_30280 [Acaryochloris marina S15]